MLDYYVILSISRQASQDEIRMAYRQKAKEYHPDLHPEIPQYEELFKLVNEAYSVLSDEQLRAVYDFKIATYTSQEETSSPAPVYTQTTSTTQPQKGHASSKNWYNTRYQYSKKVKLQGLAFITLVLLVVIGGPISMEIYTAERDFEEGMDYYNQGNFFAALNKFDLAMRDVGLRNTEACSLSCLILIYNYREYSAALRYIERGLDYAETPELTATFLYWKGLVLSEMGQAEVALASYQESAKIMQQPDSTLIQIGTLYAYDLRLYDKGLEYFDKIEDAASYVAEIEFGRGYCHYHQGLYLDAITDFQKVVKTRPANGAAFLMMGMAKFKVDQNEGGCADLQTALRLGVRAAYGAIQKKCEAG